MMQTWAGDAASAFMAAGQRIAKPGACGTFENTHFVSLLGVKRTCRFALHMSAFDPKRTLPTIAPAPFGLLV
jgi:hypothetical protein